MENMAETLMRQAGYTAEVWLKQALTATDEEFEDEKARAIVIAAFLNAAAQDQHTMTTLRISEEERTADFEAEWNKIREQDE